MLNRIRNCNELIPFLVNECCENNVCVTFDNGIHRDDYIIIKVDNFYNSQHLEHTPPSPDCLIIRKCQNGGYGLTIVELKDIHTAASFTIENIKDKFNTCLNHFIKHVFREYLDADYKDVKIFFVSNIEIHKRDLGLKLDVLINLKFPFNGKKYMIQPYMPNPTIKNCY